MKLVTKNGKAVRVGYWLYDVAGIYEVVGIDEDKGRVHAKEVFYDETDDGDLLETYTLRGDFFWGAKEVRKMDG